MCIIFKYKINCYYIFIGNELIPLEDIGEEESPYLTLEESEQLAFEKKEEAHCKKWARESKSIVQVPKLFNIKYKFKLHNYTDNNFYL